jgi:hypothetical protein
MSNTRKPRQAHCGHWCRPPEDRNMRQRGPARTALGGTQQRQAQRSLSAFLGSLSGLRLPARQATTRSGDR